MWSNGDQSAVAQLALRTQRRKDAKRELNQGENYVYQLDGDPCTDGPGFGSGTDDEPTTTVAAGNWILQKDEIELSWQRLGKAWGQRFRSGRTAA